MMRTIIFLIFKLYFSATGLRMPQQHYALMETEKKGDLLFIVPVGPVSVETIKQDINHLRNNYTGRVDVVLLHYDSLKDAWAGKADDCLQGVCSDAGWYSKNVQGSHEGKGGKFNLLTEYFRSRKEEMQKYDWIWAMDEDFKIDHMNIQSMIETATESGSKIVAPAVRFANTINTSASRPEFVSNFEKVESEVGCTHHDSKCDFQKGNDQCKYSHVNFLEVMMPMFRPDALSKILFACNHCIHQDSLWGLDYMWCKFVARNFDMKDDMKGCALLDQHRAIKLVYKTLPASYHSKDALRDVKHHNRQYWVEERERKSDCVPLQQ